MSLRKPTAEAAESIEGVESMEATELDRVAAAADVLEARQNGSQEPEGSWADRIWLPSDGERRPCCAGLEPDKLKDPQKLRSHCRTLLHVATLFDLDSHLLRAELRRRRLAREAPLEKPPRPGSLRREAAGLFRSRLGKAAQTLPRTGPGSAEAKALHAKLVRLIADKRADLAALAGQAVEQFGELHRQLSTDERLAVEVMIEEAGVQDLAGDLQVLIDDIKNLVITRDTIRRVL